MVRRFTKNELEGKWLGEENEENGVDKRASWDNFVDFECCVRRTLSRRLPSEEIHFVVTVLESS